MFGYLPERTFSRIGEEGRQEFLNFHLWQNQVRFHGKERRIQDYSWKPKNAVKENHDNEKVMSPHRPPLTHTHTIPWPQVEESFKRCFSEQYTLTHCCHIIKFMEVVICKNKNYHKVICCIIIIHKCAKCRQMCWPLKVERLTEFQPDSVL